jgi:hypothetical protein
MLQRMVASVDERMVARVDETVREEREYQDTDIIMASFASGRT